MTSDGCCEVGGVLNGKCESSERLTTRQASYAEFASIFSARLNSNVRLEAISFKDSQNLGVFWGDVDG